MFKGLKILESPTEENDSPHSSSIDFDWSAGAVLQRLEDFGASDLAALIDSPMGFEKYLQKPITLEGPVCTTDYLLEITWLWVSLFLLVFLQLEEPF